MYNSEQIEQPEKENCTTNTERKQLASTENNTEIVQPKDDDDDIQIKTNIIENTDKLNNEDENNIDTAKPNIECWII